MPGINWRSFSIRVPSRCNWIAYESSKHEFSDYVCNISRGPDGPSLFPILTSNIVCHSIIYEVHSSTGISQHIYPRNPFFLPEQTTAVKLINVNELAYRGPLFTVDISVISHCLPIVFRGMLTSREWIGIGERVLVVQSFTWAFLGRCNAHRNTVTGLTDWSRSIPSVGQWIVSRYNE